MPTNQPISCPCEITIIFISYEWDDKSSVWNINITAHARPSDFELVCQIIWIFSKYTKPVDETYTVWEANITDHPENNELD